MTVERSDRQPHALTYKASRKYDSVIAHRRLAAQGNRSFPELPWQGRHIYHKEGAYD